MSDNKLSIFMGLPDITAEAAMELAIYWRVAGGDAVGVIDNLGKMEYRANGLKFWDRPCAAQNFEILKEAFKGCESLAVQVEENRITVDFGMLQYNLDFVKMLVEKHGLGVCMSDEDKECLEFYMPTDIHGKTCYLKQEWRFRRVKPEDLGPCEKKTCAISANMGNPNTADWKPLYFPAAA